MNELKKSNKKHALDFKNDEKVFILHRNVIQIDLT